jgi:hypothetical protein
MGCRPKPAALNKPSPTGNSSHGPPQSLQYLSLRNSSPKVNLPLSSVSCFPPLKTTPQDDTVISTEAAHAFVSRAMEKSASLPRLPPEPSPRLHLLPFLVLIPPRKSAFPFPNLSPHKPPDPNPAPHPSQFIIYPLTPIHPRSTLCAYSTHWHL